MFETRGDPSTQDWSDARELIQHLYITQNMTANKVKQFMSNNHNFHATLRMYKDRFKKWEIDCKTIRQPVWKAMAEIYAFRRDVQNRQTIFELTVSNRRRRIGYKDICKHFDRVNVDKSSDIDKETFDRLAARSDLKSLTPPPEVEIIPSHRSQRPRRQPCSRERSHTAAASQSGSSSALRRARPAVRRFLTQLQASCEFSATATSSAAVMRPPLPLAELNSVDDPNILVVLADQLPSVAQSPGDLQAKIAAYAWCEPCVPRRSSRNHGVEAGAWVWDCFMICSAHGKNEVLEANEYRQRAKKTFGNLIRSGNDQVLPGLLGVSSTMIAHGRDEVLREFLIDCLEVIMTAASPNQVYEGIFGYCLAVIENDTSCIDKYGRMLFRGGAAFRLVWGEESPNVLVASYYQAWHLLREPNPNCLDAIGMMLRSLQMSEAVMGKTHPVTVHCLAILSRAYAEQNNNSDAIACLSDAIKRSQESPIQENPFRLKLMRRLAMLHKKVSNLYEAESILREVVEGRFRLLGLSNGHTWGAINDLEEVLTEIGREAEGHALLNDWDQRFYQENLSTTLIPAPQQP